jgi:P-type Cu+ transporter
MAMDVFTAVLIVACPCALALSVPFTFGSAMRILGRNKFYLKNSLNIEDLAKTDIIVFDKTGTITETDKAGIKYCGRKLSDTEKKIKGHCKNSVHPLSRRISDSIVRPYTVIEPLITVRYRVKD